MTDTTDTRSVRHTRYPSLPRTPSRSRCNGMISCLLFAPMLPSKMCRTTFDSIPMELVECIVESVSDTRDLSSMMRAQRRLHGVCEQALYKSVLFSATNRKCSPSVSNVEPLVATPRKLLDCITLSPNRISLAALIPSVRIRFIERPEALKFNYTRTRNEMKRAVAMLEYLAPTSLSLYSRYGEHDQPLLAHFLDKLDCHKLQVQRVLNLDHLQRIVKLCANTIQRVTLDHAVIKEPIAGAIPILPELRAVRIGDPFGPEGASYISAMLRSAPRLSALRLYLESAGSGRLRSADVLSAFPDGLDSLWIDGIVHGVWEGEYSALPVFDLARFRAMRTLTAATRDDPALIASLPPNLWHLRLRDLGSSGIVSQICDVQEALIRFLDTGTWQPHLTSIAIPALSDNLDVDEMLVSGYERLSQACQQRGVRLVQVEPAGLGHSKVQMICGSQNCGVGSPTSQWAHSGRPARCYPVRVRSAERGTPVVSASVYTPIVTGIR